eukprot:scaffold42254_cov65-Phaeocystis_antarctica.AAC.3
MAASMPRTPRPHSVRAAGGARQDDRPYVTVYAEEHEPREAHYREPADTLQHVRLLREPPVPWHQVKGQDVRLPPLRVDDAGVDGEGDEAKREGDGEGKAHTEREAFAHVEGSKKEEGLEEGIGQWEDELREEGEGTAKVRGPLVVQGLLRQGN